jgi:hypothetical protein
MKAFKWIDVNDQLPDTNVIILFSDGKRVYRGWLEAKNYGEEPVFSTHSLCNKGISSISWPDNVTHWMPMRKPPKAKKPSVEGD